MFEWLKDKSKSDLLPPASASTAPMVPVAPVRTAPPLPKARASTRPHKVGISYDADLIDVFTETHESLLALHGQARAAAIAQNWVLVANTLGKFRSVLMDHLLAESVRLYVYLKQSLKEEPDAQALMRRFAIEMHGIGAKVVEYLETLHDIAINPDHRASFIAQWDQIGETLTHRIEREEQTLYPLYQPMNDES
ncbi:MAG: hemerythrin domain-containing protein [Herbaspirillum sp.]